MFLILNKRFAAAGFFQDEVKGQNYKLAAFRLNASQFFKSDSFTTILTKWQHRSKRKIVNFELYYLENDKS